jgi:hypothetical protein
MLCMASIPEREQNYITNAFRFRIRSIYKHGARRKSTLNNSNASLWAGQLPIKRLVLC